MLQRIIGNTGIEVGAIAFGCWRFAGTDLDTASARINKALDLGMTLIDTADVYGLDNDCPWGAAELLLGEVLKDDPGLRKRMFLATKGGIQLDDPNLGIPYDSSANHLRSAINESLLRLNVEQVDLYQVHRPDLLTHPGELASALTSFVEDGLTRFVGVSNYTPSQVEALRAYLPDHIDLVTVQPEFSAAHLAPLDDGVLDQAMQYGYTPLAWSPLAGGRLVEEDSKDERIQAIQAVLDELGETHSATRTQIALSFVLQHPSGIIPIIGTGNLDRMAEAAYAPHIDLTNAECYRIIAASGRALP